MIIKQMTKKELRFGIVESELSASTWKGWAVLHIIDLQDLISTTKGKGHSFKVKGLKICRVIT